MKKVTLLQAEICFSMISDTLKEWGRKVNNKHEIMNKASRQFYKMMIFIDW